MMGLKNPNPKRIWVLGSDIGCQDSEIYSTSEPCPMCFSVIHWSRLKKLCFGTIRDDVSVIGFDDSLIYDILSGKAQVVLMESINVDRESCLGLLVDWDAKPDKILY